MQLIPLRLRIQPGEFGGGAKAYQTLCTLLTSDPAA
jgi:hypothetical protein